MLKLGQTLVLGAALLAFTATSHAASDSLLTLGVGTSMSMRGDNTDQVAGNVRARTRFLLGFGAELTYEPAGAGSEESSTALSGLLYLVPTSPVGGYVKAGIRSDVLGRYGEDSDRYEGGAGIEVYLDDHWVLGAEYLRSFPQWQILGDAVADGEDLWGTGENVYTVSLWYFM
ncbi:MAG: outer membrane beta-barrel protein [Myxococcota bacterium]